MDRRNRSQVTKPFVRLPLRSRLQKSKCSRSSYFLFRFTQPRKFPCFARNQIKNLNAFYPRLGDKYSLRYAPFVLCTAFGFRFLSGPTKIKRPESCRFRVLIFVDQRGIEPPTSSVQMRRSSQLSYWPVF